MKKLIFISMLAIVLLSSRSEPGPEELLSGYGFFTGRLADQVPAEGVIPYQLNTPLFSDYAEKARFIKLPQGAAVPYSANGVLQFPVGTVLIKTFYFPQTDRGKRLMETRLLIHEAGGWKALEYIWNDEQTDAVLEVAGDRKPVTITNPAGREITFDYIMPNLNQCKGCHNTNDVMQPIGPSARQLNGELLYASGTENQLQHWSRLGMLKDLPPINEVPATPVWNDPATGSLNDRARAWLDINCAHCHKQDGPARTSALLLSYEEKDSTRLGFYKTPVAAGRGSGGLQYNIVPGDPERSILVYRMASTDPGVMMPELSRKLVHAEGLELIKAWIRQMPATQP
ncbi:SO2930 family diheme c-type cytochrome [Chitinophaga sp. XS-30]|uniref:SO2930 family diheme c-type cytochrome n=1 Tax=Chitinophaga sp. XS-30 TaxID=2604421 RepID=UPI0011DDEC32|nr:SO2930 family diheme c-type cytochrome [Chitinophaga sp. XS-30]QEH41372.1 hypothetical protein FW415_10970 [Chitinophaga sp. XS-30]